MIQRYKNQTEYEIHKDITFITYKDKRSDNYKPMVTGIFHLPEIGWKSCLIRREDFANILKEQRRLNANYARTSKRT